jgi:hypothetical protein
MSDSPEQGAVGVWMNGHVWDGTRWIPRPQPVGTFSGQKPGSGGSQPVRRNGQPQCVAALVNEEESLPAEPLSVSAQERGRGSCRAATLAGSDVMPPGSRVRSDVRSADGESQ